MPVWRAAPSTDSHFRQFPGEAVPWEGDWQQSALSIWESDPAAAWALGLCAFKPLLLVLRMVSALLHAHIVLHNFEWHILMFPVLCSLCRTHFAVNKSYTGTLRGLGWPCEGLSGIIVPSQGTRLSSKIVNFLNIQMYLQFWAKGKKGWKSCPNSLGGTWYWQP